MSWVLFAFSAFTPDDKGVYLEPVPKNDFVAHFIGHFIRNSAENDKVADEVRDKLHEL